MPCMPLPRSAATRVWWCSPSPPTVRRRNRACVRSSDANTGASRLPWTQKERLRRPHRSAVPSGRTVGRGARPGVLRCAQRVPCGLRGQRDREIPRLAGPGDQLQAGRAGLARRARVGQGPSTARGTGVRSAGLAHRRSRPRLARPRRPRTGARRAVMRATGESRAACVRRGQPPSAAATAASTCSRVVAKTGTGLSCGRTSSSISVQPRITPVAPSATRRAITSR